MKPKPTTCNVAPSLENWQALDANTNTSATGATFTGETVRLWDVASGQCLKILKRHINPISTVTFSPDLASSGSETINFWAVETGECLKTFRPDCPYERMNITGVTGITEAQRISLKALGAVEYDAEGQLVP